MDREEKKIQESLEKLALSYEDEVKEAAKNVATNIFLKGAQVQDALAIPQSKVEGIYAQGYQLYNSGNFEKAYKTFEMLTLLNTKDPRFFFGIAASLQGLKKYQESFMYFLQSASLDPDNPVPFYHAADCALKMGDKMSAVIMCQLVEDRSKNRPQYDYIKERSKVLKEQLKKELNEEGKKLMEAKKK